MSSFRRTTRVGLIVALAGLGGPGIAAARQVSNSLVLHLKFHRVVIPTREKVFPLGRYVFHDDRYFGPGLQTGGSFGPLVDEQTGRRTMLSPPDGCGANGVTGGPWLMFLCVSSQQQMSWLDLYAAATGTWRAAQVPAHPCYGDNPSYCFETPVNVGRQWIEFLESDCYHCGSSRRFENIWTGAIRGDPTTATTIPDLDRPALSRKLCSPLRVPAEPGSDLPAYESFSIFGPYGVGYLPPAYTAQRGPWDGDYLQRCGSHERPSAVGALANSHLLLINGVAGHKLEGVFLPNGPKFAIPLPAGVAARIASGPGDVALSDRTLFIGTENVANTTGAPTPNWVAKLPTKPPAPKRPRDRAPAPWHQFRFRVVAGPNQRVASDGRYTIIWQESYRQGGRIVDEATGRMTRFRPPAGCDVAPVVSPLGGKWALAGCGALDEQYYGLYNIPAKTWRPLTPSFARLRANAHCASGDPSCAVKPLALGARWIEFLAGCGGPHCKPQTLEVQDLMTGAVKVIPSHWLQRGSNIIDLDSPSFGRAVCRPVKLPPSRLSHSVLPATATRVGSFVISTGLVNRPGTLNGPIYLQQCRSKRRIQIDPQDLGLAANGHAVLWPNDPAGKRMTGWLLPRLTRITFNAPGGVPILSDHHLYIQEESTHVWSAPVP